MPHRIALIKTGSFSHTNEQLLSALRESFPECEIDVIDLDRLVTAKDPRNLVALVREYGAEIVAGRVPVRARILRTSFVFRQVRRHIGRLVRPERYALSLQTQSLFDASVPGVPHLVYTDHTHLQNLRYPYTHLCDLLPWWWIELERSIYHHADRVLTMSRSVARSVIHEYGCPPGRVSCVYVGMNAPPPDGAAPPRAPGSGASILFVGTAWERKGGPELLRAFESVRHRHPEATLTVVGCAPSVDAPNCHVVGRVPLGEMGRYYEEADVFCLPTRCEAQGIAILEAMGHGLPVIATRIGAIPEAVKHGTTGYLVGVGDVGAIAEALDGLLADPARRVALGEEGRRLVRARYTWPLVGARIRQVAGEVAGDLLRVEEAPEAAMASHPMAPAF